LIIYSDIQKKVIKFQLYFNFNNLLQYIVLNFIYQYKIYKNEILRKINKILIKKLKFAYNHNDPKTKNRKERERTQQPYCIQQFDVRGRVARGQS
jgi:hypothetical protein